MKIIAYILEIIKYILSKYEENKKRQEQEEYEKQIQENREDPVKFFENKFSRNDSDNDNSLHDDDSNSESK